MSQSKLIIAAMSVLAGASAAQAATFSPIPVTGFSHDMIVGTSETFATGLTATMDDGEGLAGSTFFQTGVASGGIGLPTGNVVIDADYTFGLPSSYVGNNALLICIPFDAYGSHTTNHPNGTLNFTTPAAYSALSFLVSGGGGSGNVGYTINYAAGALATGNIFVQDWGNSPWSLQTDRWGGSGTAATGFGMFRVDVTGLTNPSDITSIAFTNVGPNGNKSIFAVSGVAVPEPASLAGLGLVAGMLLRRRRA